MSGFALSLFYWVCYVRLDIVRTQRLFLMNRQWGTAFLSPSLPLTSSHGAKASGPRLQYSLDLPRHLFTKEAGTLWMNMGRKSIPADVDLSEGTWQQPCPAIVANSARRRKFAFLFHLGISEPLCDRRTNTLLTKTIHPIRVSWLIYSRRQGTLISGPANGKNGKSWSEFKASFKSEERPEHRVGLDSDIGSEMT